MRIRLLVGGLMASLALLCVPAIASAQGVQTKKLHFLVHIGPGHKTTCNLIGEIFRPDSVSAKHPAPAILTTNGFGGSYQSQAALAQTAAKAGYVVLSYSGLGFGGSSCRITLDSTQWDGEAASQLVTFLGGGMKAVGGYKVNYVAKQKVAPNGKRYKYDPRVGMIGGSYGGAVQFAAAADDPRIDTIIPMITWNNLDYSLAPNNATLAPGTVNYTTPGITKAGWLGVFWGLGTAFGQPVSPSGGPSKCSNFAGFECAADTNLVNDGYADGATLALVKKTSVANFMNKIQIPTLLMQGEDDTLFTLHEAVATYTALRKEHTPVKMVWQSWGHSDGTPAPGEWSANALNSSGSLTLEGHMVMDWFKYYLKHQGAKPVMNFSYYRPWVKYKGNDAAAAYKSAAKYPVGSNLPMFLSGDDSLVQSGALAEAGSSDFTTPATGAQQSVSDAPLSAQPAPTDPNGTYAEYESAPLSSAVDVVGIPKLTVSVQLSEPMPSALGFGLTATSISNTVGLYFKVEDVSSGNTVTLPDGLIAAARVSTSGSLVTVSLPGIVHRFKAGDRIALVVAGSDNSYFLANPGVSVTVNDDGGVLDLPVVGASIRAV